MCRACGSGKNYWVRVESWAERGLPYRKIDVLARPSARKYPNTYVYVFRDAEVVEGELKDIFLDIHYEGDRITPGARRSAFGGLWMQGVDGDMKPEQHGGTLLEQLRAELPSNAPGGVDGVWGNQGAPANVTVRTGEEKNLYPVTGWGNPTPARSMPY